MKKLLFISLIGLISLAQAQAQNKPNAFVEVFGGINTVSGNFSQADYSNASSGFAKAGYVLGVQGAFFFGGNLGLGVTLSQSDYGVNTMALADGYREDFDVDEATVASKHYKFNNLLVGPYYSFAFGRVTLDLRGLVGISAATLPALRVALEDQSTFTQNKATATGFAYQVGAGLRVPIVKNLGLSLRADYANTKPKFVVAYDNINNSSGRTITGYNQPVSNINGTLGIFYQFGK
ncbi:outer membrane beta-barrel protein [Spirosoma aerolatum]|uniref:outer membrane beta-barrel protein n=1 Tax=Spirosoma aerolatum TaxID=1211326 RepID=UPI0009ADDEE1|nr:outer membrane beta-barrel protein [Spirosoma aerolatum]